eukprot:1007801-Prymnesium_polylepis.1
MCSSLCFDLYRNEVDLQDTYPRRDEGAGLDLESEVESLVPPNILWSSRRYSLVARRRTATDRVSRSKRPPFPQSLH